MSPNRRFLLLSAVAAALVGARPGETRSRPAAARPPRLVVQLGHSTAVDAVAFSPDGRRVLTGSWDGTAKLWDSRTGDELLCLAGHVSGVTGVAFSPDGHRILTGSDDGTAKLWDAQTGEELRSFTGHSKDVWGVALSPDGRHVLTGSQDGTAKLWDAQTGEELRSFTGHSKEVSSVAFSPDGRHVLTGSWDGSAKLWDAATGRELLSLTDHGGRVWSVAFSPDGRRVLTTGKQTAKLWDAETGKELRSLAVRADLVIGVAFSPDGRRVLTGGGDSTATLWNAETGDEIRSFKDRSAVLSVAFSPDGRRILTGDLLSTATLWDAETGRELRSFIGHSGTISSVAFSHDGVRVLTGGRMVTLWDGKTGKDCRSFKAHSLPVTGAAFSADDRRVLTGGWDRTARLWDAETGKELRSFKGHSWEVAGVAFSPDGRRVLTGGGDGTAKLWDAETGTELRTFTGHASEVAGVAFSPDGRRVLTGSRDGTAKLWDAETGKELRSFTNKRMLVLSVAFSPDGQRVLTGGASGTAQLWDTETGTELRTFAGHASPVTSVAFSPDGQRVLTGGRDRTAKLWDTETGTELRTFRGHASGVESVAFSPDGRRVLTGSTDSTAKIWEADTGNCLATLVSFNDGTWAVVDSAGRFDASNEGKVEGLHWIVGDTPIALSQLSERYYEPGLLAKAMGYNREPLRQVRRFEDPKLFPAVELAPLAPGATALKIHLTNQGGGIGRVQVLVNGKEVAADARGPRIAPNAVEASLEVKLLGAPAMRPGKENRVEVIAWNAEGHIASRGAEVVWRAPGKKEVEPPEIFAIVIGTARYGSPSMNLTFAGKDAADMAKALAISAKRLFGAQKVHLTLLTDYPGAEDARPPSRDNLESAFRAARQARPDDVLVVYLAGHGAVAPDGEYWYLTREARTTDLADPEVRKASGVSSAELTEWIKAIPVTKQVLILDTCAAGAAAARLTEVRALSSNQVRAIARLKDRTGLHVLMGSAADAASYEASQYGQGLLTYSLLLGMRGAALKDGEFVDVSSLFDYARDEVPNLARSIGGIQEPKISAPKGESFPIGQLTSEDKRLVPVAVVRPMILRASFQREQPPFDDRLDLSKGINAALRDAADPAARGGNIVFVDGDELPDALRLTGRYRQLGDTVRIDSYLLEGEAVRAHFTVSGPTSDLKALARAVVEKAEAAVAR